MVEDWSLVRSPSRARRRLKQGHRQNIRWVDQITVEQWVRAVRHMLLRENVEALKKMQETMP